MKIIVLLVSLVLCMGAGSCQPDSTPPEAPPSVSTCDARMSSPIAKRSFADRQRALVQSRIVGGHDASIEDYPWAVALTFSNGFQFCGGSLIAPEWVLTAAHCKVEGGDIAILGRENLSTSIGEEIAIDYSLTHGEYNPATSQNDIALLRLSRPASQEFIDLIPTDGPNIVASSLTVVGWGATQEGGFTSRQLQAVELPVVSNETCKQVYGETITDSMVCAGFATGGQDSCQGDSGGPLFVERTDGKAFQAGVVSFGVGCARPGVYGVYTRVSSFLDWVTTCSNEDVKLISFDDGSVVR